jgi:hypothetical protein
MEVTSFTLVVVGWIAILPSVVGNAPNSGITGGHFDDCVDPGEMITPKGGRAREVYPIECA